MGFCALVFASITSMAQTTVVTGKVTDDKGKPIEGASVVEKKTQKGTATDQNGLFSLNVKSGSTLIISGVGFEKKEIVANGTVNVSLKQLSQDLSEVVVTALGVKREKKALGYAVTTVGKDELELRPEGDVARVLNGKAPGLNILNTSGLSG
ncbi:MAG: carboxypeptidase-like regulatory domain-containing protein, partial [Bacteroidota bacterium]|nr:carboxypeptidase-like regulatory domain-containing protein [Bacteroidota bacterium]